MKTMASIEKQSGAVKKTILAVALACAAGAGARDCGDAWIIRRQSGGLGCRESAVPAEGNYDHRSRRSGFRN
jgi:hypothetical protein